MMMSEHKDPTAVHYPQLDSEQRKNEEEEEKSHRASLFKPFPCLFQKKKKKRARMEGRKRNIEFENLAGLGSTLAAQDSRLFVFLSGIPDEPRY